MEVEVAILGTIVGIVGVIAVLNLFLTLAIMRRMRAGTGTQTLAAPPQQGMNIPEFEAQSHSGRTITDSEFRKGAAFVAFVAVNCEPCSRLPSKLAATPLQSPAFFFVSGATDSDGHLTERGDEFVTALEDYGEVVLMDVDSELRDSFKIRGVPTLLSVSDGVVRNASFKFEDIAAANAVAAVPA